MATCADLYKLSLVMKIVPLQTQALEAFRKSLARGWNTCTFVNELRLIGLGTYPGPEHTTFRQIMVYMAAAKLASLLRRPDFVKICTENGALAVDIMKVGTLRHRMKDAGDDNVEHGQQLNSA